MSTYYGAVMGGSSRTVLCHRITVETYTRTLPNGKTVTVRGYSRAGDAAARGEAASRERQARSQITTGRERIRSAYNGPYSHDMGTRTRVHTAVRGAGEVARGYADLARNKLNDIKETMQVGIGNFMEQAKLAGSTVGAYCELGIGWVKNLIGNVVGAIGRAIRGPQKSTAVPTRTNASGEVTNKKVIKNNSRLIR